MADIFVQSAHKVTRIMLGDGDAITQLTILTGSDAEASAAAGSSITASGNILNAELAVITAFSMQMTEFFSINSSLKDVSYLYTSGSRPTQIAIKGAIFDSTCDNGSQRSGLAFLQRFYNRGKISARISDRSPRVRFTCLDQSYDGFMVACNIDRPNSDQFFSLFAINMLELI